MLNFEMFLNIFIKLAFSKGQFLKERAARGRKAH